MTHTTRRPLTTLACAILLTYGSSIAQNLVKNPDFDQGTSNWTLGPTLRAARIVASDLTGVRSPALEFEHVAGTGAAKLHQDLGLRAGLQRLRFFAAATMPAGGTISIRAWLHNLKTQAWHLSYSTTLQNRSQAEERLEVAVDWLPKFDITPETYRLTIEYEFYGVTFQKAVCQLDRVEFAAARLPLTSLDQVVSNVGNQATLWTTTSGPGTLVIQYLSWGLLAKPIPIPGIRGALELDLGTLVTIPAGRRSGANWFTTLPPWPAVLRGIPFHAQSLSIDTATFDLDLGSRTWHAVR
ncbi:MAG: hypothetical protein H6832_03790 [Planctomycetes bacterium]|nr:hypothetical protein [Planctomycetota bacterium]